MKKIFLILFSVITLMTVCSCSFFNPEKKFNGFTQKIKDALKSNYEMTIPDSAVFIDGYDISGQDAFIDLFFSIPKEDLDDMLSDKWVIQYDEDYGNSIENGISIPVGLFDTGDSKFICKYDYTGQAFTELYYAYDGEDNIKIVFMGYRPHY